MNKVLYVSCFIFCSMAFASERPSRSRKPQPKGYLPAITFSYFRKSSSIPEKTVKDILESSFVPKNDNLNNTKLAPLDLDQLNRTDSKNSEILEAIENCKTVKASRLITKYYPDRLFEPIFAQQVKQALDNTIGKSYDLTNQQLDFVCLVVRKTPQDLR